MNRKYFAIFLLSISSLAQIPGTNPAMSYEETVVRSSYAKLAYAAQIDAIRMMIDEYQFKHAPADFAALKSRIKDSEIKFELNSIRVGDFSEIAQTTYADLVTKPNGEDVLSVAIGTWAYTTDEPKEVRSIVATPSWIKAQVLTEDWNIPFSKALQMVKDAGAEDFSPYNRFAAVSATVTFQGRSRSYHALFEFGKDAQGQQHLLVIDMVTGGSALNFYARNSVYPATLLETGLRNIPFVAQWLEQNTVSGAEAGKREVSCDLEALSCGLAADDVRHALNHKAAAKTAPRLPELRPHLLQASYHPRVPGFFFMQSDPCAVFNTSTGPTPGSTPLDVQQHTSGGHYMTYNSSTSCGYTTGNNSNGACNTSCTATLGGQAHESGGVSGFCHVAQISQQVGGSAQANGAGVSCNSAVAMGVKSCVLCTCNVSFSVSGSGSSGAGGSITITSDGFYTVQQNNTNNCSQQIAASGGGGGCDPTTGSCNGCSTVPLAGGPIGSSYQECDPGTSPIILDVGDEGFHLTSAYNGVVFDIRGNGSPLHIAWTDPHYRNAFLALPGPDGLIHDGKQLFGNFTPQPPTARPNGFLALAQWDKPENGGNGDGVIDQKDAVYSKLRLWIDDNHDGICQANELYTLPDLGVSSISLHYHLSKREDQYGNVFRYRSRVNPPQTSDQSEIGKTAYDVFFTAIQ